MAQSGLGTKPRPPTSAVVWKTFLGFRVQTPLWGPPRLVTHY